MAFTDYYAEFTEGVLDSVLHPESAIRPTMAGPGNKFQNQGFQKAGKFYFETGFRKQSISQESHFTMLLSRIHRKRVSEILLYPECTTYKTHHG